MHPLGIGSGISPVRIASTDAWLGQAIAFYAILFFWAGALVRAGLEAAAMDVASRTSKAGQVGWAGVSIVAFQGLAGAV